MSLKKDQEKFYQLGLFKTSSFFNYFKNANEKIRSQQHNTTDFLNLTFYKIKGTNTAHFFDGPTFLFQMLWLEQQFNQL